MALRYEINLKPNVTFTLGMRCAKPDEVVYAAISSITQTAPAQVTTDAPHGLLTGWPVWVESVKGMVEINNPRPSECGNNDVCPPYIATVNGLSSVLLNAVNAAGWGAYRGGGVLAWQKPRDITGYSATFIATDEKGDVLWLLNSSLLDMDGAIETDPATSTVSLRIDPQGQAKFSGVEMSYQIILTDPADGNKTYLLAEGPIKVK
jgi:hypothetical protein